MRMAASLRDLGATCCDADAVFQDLLTEIPNVLRSLANNDPGLPKFWAERDALFGQPVRLKLGEVIERGIGAGIDRDGALVLSNNEGTKTHHGGQVLRDHP